MKALTGILFICFCFTFAKCDSNLQKNYGNFNWTSYHTLDAFNGFLDDTLRKYPDVTEGFVLGNSYENRTIRGIKISYREGNPGVYIESTIHAREWIAGATATWIINELLSSTDPAVRKLAEEQDWYIVPILNVDGYVYTHTTDRFWRKNRQPTTDPECIGHDLNRNFDAQWKVVTDATYGPCGPGYQGVGPHSAPEAKAEAEFLQKHKEKINLFLAFHSFGKFVFFPYDYTDKRAPNYRDLRSMARTYANAIKRMEWKTDYKVGQQFELLYVASGQTLSYAYDKLGILASFTIEMRGDGFELPEDEIIPNSKETLAGIQAMIKKARKLKYMNVKY